MGRKSYSIRYRSPRQCQRQKLKNTINKFTRRITKKTPFIKEKYSGHRQRTGTNTNVYLIIVEKSAHCAMLFMNVTERLPEKTIKEEE
jgi:hypothetical protein